jgi:hypothetical protein
MVMDPRFFRNYANLIEAAERDEPAMQLDEGALDSIKMLASKAMKLLGGNVIADIANQVKQVTGGDYTPSRQNALKVAQALGFDKMAKRQVAEGFAGNWQGKVLQIAHLAISGGALAQFFGGQAVTGMQGFGGPGELLMAVGMILLMVTNTFWSSESGMVGSMGKFGNTGTSTRYGSDRPAPTAPAAPATPLR